MTASDAPSPGVPAPDRRTRVWLLGTAILALAVDVALWRYDLELPGFSGFGGRVYRQVLVAFIAVGFLLVVPKISRREMGLTLWEPRTTCIETLRQLGVLGCFALLYMIAATLIARITHVQIPVRPGSLEDPAQFWEFLIPAVIAAPLHEELIARGLMTSAFYWPDRKWLTVAVCTPVFALLHLFTLDRPSQLGGVLFMAILLGWSFVRTRSVFTSFVLHSVFNLGVLVKDLIILKDPGFVRRILGYE